MTEFKTKNATNAIDQALFSPDLTPCDVFLFSKFKLSFCGTHFQLIKDIGYKNVFIDSVSKVGICVCCI